VIKSLLSAVDKFVERLTEMIDLESREDRHCLTPFGIDPGPLRGALPGSSDLIEFW
jgi:hypothetical protein